jgi:hypothetical protein
LFLSRRILINLEVAGRDRKAPKGQTYLHHARFSERIVKKTEKTNITMPEWIKYARPKNGLNDCVNKGMGENQPKKVHPERIGIRSPPTNKIYLINLNLTGNHFLNFLNEIMSCMNPMGQIHPQNALPKIVVAMSMIIAATSDKRGMLDLESIALRL